MSTFKAPMGLGQELLQLLTKKRKLTETELRRLVKLCQVYYDIYGRLP